MEMRPYKHDQRLQIRSSTIKKARHKEHTWEKQPPPQLLPVKQMGGYLSGETFSEARWEEYI
ncbi:MAG: hypothetical protein FRX49_01258 [Trebouxia sp. A1-2]|nr:MAG: hypothetical protein FRX49_01258 [Trebouxia sp. A1-2]